MVGRTSLPDRGRGGPRAQQRQNPAYSVEHEAVLAGVMALAGLFSSCVEAFNLIHPVHRFERDEQLLLCRLGIEQARLLVWGDVVGISSPPASVTDRAVPKHPSSVYPDLSEPTFFGPRDPRLDETPTRTAIEAALSAIVDRSSSTATREEMMEKYGLRPPKRLGSDIYQPPLDTNRLEAFREHYELLKEVGETYGRLATPRRNHSIVQTTWLIANPDRFQAFIALMQEKIDGLISLLDAAERVDRAVAMDIRAIGWHLTNDKGRIASDRTVLRLVHDVARDHYPQYIPAVDVALANIEREWKEVNPSFNPYKATSMAAPPRPPGPGATNGTPVAAGPVSTDADRVPLRVFPAPPVPGVPLQSGEKHHGLLSGLFKSFKSKDKTARRASLSDFSSPTSQPPRSLSESGPTRPGEDYGGSDLVPARSKSVGALLVPDDEVESEQVSPATTPAAVPTSNPVATAASATVSAGTEAEAPTQQPAIKSDIADFATPVDLAPTIPSSLAQQLEQEVGGEASTSSSLERTTTSDTLDTIHLPLEGTSPVTSMISRHDMYHGLGRQGTKNQ